MRTSGARVELVWLRPHDHIGWVFDSSEAFAEVAERFLREGRELGERLVFIAENPADDAYRRLASAFAAQDLEIASIADVYGASGVVDAARQRMTFAATLAQAFADGYTGIRVAADNTSLVQTPQRYEAWINWELVADRFMAENQVTGLCGFNRTAVDVDRLRNVVTLHPVSSVHEPVPQYRLFADGDGLRLEGDVDDFAVQHLVRVLNILPKDTPSVVDISGARLRGSAASALHTMVGSGLLIAN